MPILNNSVSILVVSIVALFLTNCVDACSEADCAPRVSKCMLIDACNCTINSDSLKSSNCTCCKDCQLCLGELLSDCCSCVGLCKLPKGMDEDLMMRSYIHDLSPEEDQENLFRMLTETEDQLARWTTVTFPAIETGGFLYKDKENTALAESKVLEDLYKDVNCTVAFWSQCCAMDRCHRTCSTMGASSFRWFHNGCCECVGPRCLNYGLRRAQCSRCAEEDLLKENVLPSGRSTGAGRKDEV